MAGPWLKMECATPEKPEVLAITAAMGWDDPDLTVGKLFRLWRWFDQHTTDGNAVRVTSALLDRVLGVAGFVQAVSDAGWLTVKEDGICLSNFDRHNGDTAKNRALTAKRVADHKSNAKGNGEGNGASVTAALPRGRGRDRSNTSIPNGIDSAKPRASKKCPDSWTLSDDMRAWCSINAHTLRPDDEVSKFKDHTFKTAINDWDGAFRNWMRKAVEYSKPPDSSKPTETPYQRAMREKVEQAAGSMAHIVAAKAPGTTRPPEPWEIATNERIGTSANRAIANGVGGQDLFEVDG